jgi:uncharacterized protein (TIGR00290 family)
VKLQAKLALAWSSGKDSAWMLHVLRQQAEYEPVVLVTTFNEAFDRVAMHAVRRELVEAQARAAGLDLIRVPIPWPCSNPEYEQAMAGAIAGMKNEYGVTHMAFGDLFLQEVRTYREARLRDTGVTPVFPLWQQPTAGLSRAMIRGGLKAVITCVDPKHLPAAFAGRRYDDSLLEDLPPGVDPCGENGEFHSFAYAGPMFNSPITVKTGEIVTRDGFVFADVMLI